MSTICYIRRKSQTFFIPEGRRFLCLLKNFSKWKWKSMAGQNYQPTKFGFTWELPFPLRALPECLKIILLWFQPPSSVMFLQISHRNFPSMCHKRVNYKWNSLHCMKKLLTHFSNTFSVWIQMLFSPIDLYNVQSPQTPQDLKHIIKCFSSLWILFTEIIIILTR